jgi:tetratricopeptide (TPR) repeat protein
MSGAPLKRFVRSAWALLLFQLLAAFAAVGVTAWAAFQVRPLLAQREELASDVAALADDKNALEAANLTLETERRNLASENERLADRLTRGRQEARVRAADHIRRGINAYHAGDYASAIADYDEALGLDPENAYTLDLKSYSQFRGGDLNGAIASISTALSVDPSYVYGYSELARYACAAERYDFAVETYQRAKADYPGVASLFASLLRDDGQFAELCAPVNKRFE